VLLSDSKVDFKHGNGLVMPTMTVWLVGTVLEIALLVRGYQAKLVRQFPIFYSYLLFVTANDFLRIAVYRWSPNHYFQVFWITQFLGLAIGSGVIFEIYRVALRSFPGTARMARYILFVVFGAVFARTIASRSGDLISWLASSSLLLERNLRIVQALAILTLVTLFAWYAIPFGRNLKGILIGYSLFVGLSIAQYMLWLYHWDLIKSAWQNAEGVSYLLVLGIWVRMLWAFQPVSATERDLRLESDYNVIVASTRDQFRRTLARLGWAARA
jgi:hypothetical protein